MTLQQPEPSHEKESQIVYYTMKQLLELHEVIEVKHGLNQVEVGGPEGRFDFVLTGPLNKL